MFIDDVKVVVAVSTVNGAAGTTTITSAAVDTAGYAGCLFIVTLGPITAGAATSLKVQQSSDDAASDAYDDLTGTAQTIADTDDNLIRTCDIFRPQKRYLKMVIARATQNATIGGVCAVLYGAKGVKPVSQSTSHVIGGETFLSPAEGTA